LRLIVAEVVMEYPEVPGGYGLAAPKPEGTTWYPDGRVFVLTRPGTPNWRSGERRRRQGGYLRRNARL